MSVRLATPEDEPAITALCTAAFFEENLFGVTIHPHRHQYPDDIIIFWHQWLRDDFAEPRNRILVTTTTFNGEEMVTGMATWQRQGDDPGAQKVISEWIAPGEYAFQPLPSTRNRAIDPTKSTILQDSEPFFKHHWAPTTHGVPRSQNWYLHLCAVDPAYHKRGFGQQLVKWGLDRAREENVHASVMTSDGANPFYFCCGFDEKVGNCTEGEGNPFGLANVKGGDILFKWAKDN